MKNFTCHILLLILAKSSSIASNKVFLLLDRLVDLSYDPFLLTLKYNQVSSKLVALVHVQPLVIAML